MAARGRPAPEPGKGEALHCLYYFPSALGTTCSSSPSWCRGAGQTLVLRSRIHLSEMVPHPAFGICFQLEYVFCSAGRAGGKVGQCVGFILY